MLASRSLRPRSIRTNLTPLIDMSFLLITFFVMTLRLGLSQEEKIELPKADQAQTTHESQVEVLTIDVDRAGRVLWGGKVWQLDALETALRALGNQDDKKKVVVRADARSPFAKVQRVMRTAARAGVTKLSLAALKLGDEA